MALQALAWMAQRRPAAFTHLMLKKGGGGGGSGGGGIGAGGPGGEQGGQAQGQGQGQDGGGSGGSGTLQPQQQLPLSGSSCSRRGSESEYPFAAGAVNVCFMLGEVLELRRRHSGGGMLRQPRRAATRSAPCLAAGTARRRRP